MLDEEEIKATLIRREELRKAKDFEGSDALRQVCHYMPHTARAPGEQAGSQTRLLLTRLSLALDRGCGRRGCAWMIRCASGAACAQVTLTLALNP